MSNLLKIVCIAITLFYVSATKVLVSTSPYTTSSSTEFDAIIYELEILTKYNQPLQCNPSLVPKLGNTKDVSVAEISCRAVKSLERACKSEHENLKKIKHLFSKSKKGMKCSIDIDEEQDLHSFLRSLLSYFRHRMINKPK